MSPATPPRLFDQIRACLRLKHYSVRTEEQYLGWIRRFILFHDKCHPRDMGAAEVTEFLNDLAQARNVERMANSALMLNPEYQAGLAKYLQGVGSKDKTKS